MKEARASRGDRVAASLTRTLWPGSGLSRAAAVRSVPTQECRNARAAIPTATPHHVIHAGPCGTSGSAPDGWPTLQQIVAVEPEGRERRARFGLREATARPRRSLRDGGPGMRSRRLALDSPLPATAG